MPLRPFAGMIFSAALLAACAPAAQDLVIENGAAPSISDEQDFGAVSARETIESNQQRIEEQRGQYIVVAPTDLPQRSAATAGPSIIDYALSTTNQPGEQIYSRLILRLVSAERACAGFVSADLAQEAFLRGGGPKRDSRGLDPDGDGFACDWDPRPYRAALN